MRPCSQQRCTGKRVTTTFRQELIERELPTIPGASKTILRTRSIVLMPIEANVPKQQEEGSANVSSTLFSNCMRAAAGPPVRAENLKRTVLVEFTVHTGDEILRDDEWAGDWTAAEAFAG